VVLDSQLRTPLSAKVVGPNTLIATTRSGELGEAETLVLAPTADGRVGLAPLLDELGRRGILSLLVEGGAEVHASFFAEGLVDRVQAYLAPIIIGGREAPGPVGGDGILSLSNAITLHEVDTTRIGDDLWIAGYVDVHRDS
jgi:diaminohydroxyphosphoribosylaminopyrimidine deaminase/5-amino-6-(5-phosphoribosylamino)uracil reductase